MLSIERKPLAFEAVPACSVARTVHTPSTCSSMEATASFCVKMSHSTSPEDREAPVLPELAPRGPSSLEELLPHSQEYQPPATVAPDSDSVSPERPRQGNHEARASLKLTLPSICDRLLLPSPPLEPRPTCAWTSQPVDTQPNVTDTAVRFSASSSMDGRTPNSPILSRLLPPEPLNSPVCPSTTLHSEARPGASGSSPSLEPTPGEYHPSDETGFPEPTL